ncbi:sigma factor-like helix-turn-helix DNA-binding protein [Azospirillum sp. sgz301742]
MSTISRLKSTIPNLRCYSRALTGDWEVADDLVAECLRIAMENLDEIPHDGLRVWLFTRLHDLIAHMAPRGQQPRKAPALARGPPSDTRVADSREPGLQLAFHALTFAQKAVLFLVSIEEFSVQEVAAITRMTVRNVRRSLREAFDQLDALPLGFLALKEGGSG